MIRRGALNDFDTMSGSTEWRTYLACYATFLKRRRRGAAQRPERPGHVRARLHQQDRRLLGTAGGAARLSLRPEVQGSFEMIASLRQRHLRGLVIMALSTPSWHRGGPGPTFGATQAAEWSQVALSARASPSPSSRPDPNDRLEQLPAGRCPPRAGFTSAGSASSRGHDHPWRARPSSSTVLRLALARRRRGCEHAGYTNARMPEFASFPGGRARVEIGVGNVFVYP